MDSDQWNKIDSLFQSALELPTGERDEFLRKACGGNQAIEREVRSLLSAREEAGSFLDSPAIDGAAQALAASRLEDTYQSLGENATTARPLPAQIGRYKIVRILGEGGMGVVYEATQETPHRTVALKVVKPGLDSSLLRRFEHESQALARLQHTGIAHIYDAGVADTGSGPQPYFAMEFICGKALRDYVEARHLSLRERLGLMVKICQAVNHAHQRGLIHRDLKPGNILVDDTGQPKILDFGVARVTDNEAQVTRQTDVGQILGTLEYMSPEQVLGDPEEVDTRSDVYSLGVILYEMLAGKRPYKLKRQLHEAVQAIREEDPAPLSAVSRNYRGDLETIVAKTLEKDKERRYGSAAALASDLERYLTDQPITARPDTVSYRLRKYVRRHRVGVMVAAGSVLLLIAFAVAQTVQLYRITRERDRADRITKFMTDMFKVSDPSEARGNSITAREILDKASMGIDTGLAGDPEVQAQMLHVIGNVYGNLGLYSGSERLLSRAVAIRRQVLGPNDPGTLDSMNHLSWVLLYQGRYAEAEKLQRDALERERQVLGNNSPETAYAIDGLASTLGFESRYAEAEKLYRESLDAEKRIHGQDSREYLIVLGNLGWLLEQEGHLADSENVLRDAVNLARRTHREDDPIALNVRTNLSATLMDEGRYAEAEKLQSETIDIQRRVLGAEHRSTLASMQTLATILGRESHYAEAEKLYLQTLDIQRRVLGPEHPETGETLYDLGYLAAREGNKDEALSFFVEAVDHGLRPSVALEMEEDTDLTLLHDDPRFAALMDRVKKKAASLTRK
jgi:serine/threonine protein kinase